MTSFKVDWNNPSTSLDEFERLASKPQPAFLNRKKSIAGRNNLPVLAPIGQGRKGRVSMVKEGGDKKDMTNKRSKKIVDKKAKGRKTKSAVTDPQHAQRDGHSNTSNSKHGCTQSKPLDERQSQSHRLSNFEVLGGIKKCPEPTTVPSTISQSSSEMKDNESLIDNQRRHESLAERVKNMISSRVHEDTAHAQRRTCSPYKKQSRESTNNNSRSATRDSRRNEKVAKDGCDSPISYDVEGKFDRPHPPVSPHVVLSRRVYEYRNRRFQFATLLNKKRSS